MFISRFGDAIASGIERITGWRPGIRTKTGLEWTGAVTGAVLGIWGVMALIGGGGQATKGDIETLRVEFRQAMAKREALGHNFGNDNRVGSLDRDNTLPGNVEEVVERTRIARNIDEMLGGKDGIASFYINLSNDHQTRGEWDKAEEMHRKALEINHALGGREGSDGESDEPL